MIATLAGQVMLVAADHAVIEVGGVGFLVQASARTLGRLGGEGSAVRLFTHLQLREDALTLFGFIDGEEQQAFRILTQVQGVGGRVALAILSVLPPADLATAIAAEDRRALSRADGVGPKLAGRIVSELKDKLPQLAGSGFTPTAVPAKGGKVAATASADTPAGSAAASALAEAVSALANLGYDRSEAHRAVLRVAAGLGDEPALDALIRLALKELAPT